ncbi:hypothetical protein IFR05_015589 [Cadophora sp. M221]|nr:hypothetical protein IFR05_015589 [Cadophora sp. M221]
MEFTSDAEHVRMDVPSSHYTPGQECGRIIQVRTVQTLFYQAIPPAPIVGQQSVPPGRFEYTWRLCVSNPPNPSNFTNRAEWEAYLVENPVRLELRDDDKSEVVRFNADRDTIYMDNQSLFALTDFITPRGEPGVGGRSFGYGPPEAERRLRLIGFEHIQRLGIPIAYPPGRRVFTWLRKNVMTSLREEIPTPPALVKDNSSYSALGTPPATGNERRFPGMGSRPVSDRCSLCDFLVRGLLNIFDGSTFQDMPSQTDEFDAASRAFASNREGAAREFFLQLPTPEDKDPGSESICSHPGPPSGVLELQETYSQLLTRFDNVPDETECADSSDPEVENHSSTYQGGLRGPNVDPRLLQPLVKRNSLRRQREEVSRGHREITALAEALLKSKMDQHDKDYREVGRKTMSKEMRKAGAAEYKAKWEVLKAQSRELLHIPNSRGLLPESDFARLTALVLADDCEDEFRQIMKRAAAYVLQWREVEAKQTMRIE